jgi:competence protein ComEA helix-hairpin-helix repeat region
MKSVSLLLKSLLLSLLLVVAGGALASDTVDINTADAATLEKVLVGVGPSKAVAIVQYREEHGPFKSADELANVKGIGLKTVERNRDLITVGEAASAAKPAQPAAEAKGGAAQGAAPAPVARR